MLKALDRTLDRNPWVAGHMKLQQLRFLCQVVASNFNVTLAARRLNTSQSGVSHQIRALEEELGATIFLRREKRLLGLTDAGKEIVLGAKEVLFRAEQLKEIAADFEAAESGSLTVATTHVHARFALLKVISAFARKYKSTTLRLIQTVPAEILRLVDDGEADLGVTTEVPLDTRQFDVVPAYPLGRALVAPPRHPLLRRRRPTLAEIARFPLIIYDARMASGRVVLDAFARAGIEPNVMITAIDADVIKAYVGAGLGVAIVPTLAHEKKTDVGLRAVDLSHIFPFTTTNIVIRRGSYLRGYTRAFIKLVAADWDGR
jgi:DNA-binding transcriptional LysR family regulator